MSSKYNIFALFFIDTHTKTRTTDCHPFVEVVGYLCSRIINAAARAVYMVIYARASTSTCL